MRFDELETAVFTNRGSIPCPAGEESGDGPLGSDAYHDARLAALGWDVYHLEQRWRKWLGENEIEPRNPDRHFIKFCQSWFEKRQAEVIYVYLYTLIQVYDFSELPPCPS